MKFLKVLILILICYTSQAQSPFSRIAQPLIWTQGGFDSLFLPNHDTIIPKDKSKAWVVVKDTAIYIWKGLRWQAFTGGATGSSGTVSPSNIVVGTIAQLRASNSSPTTSYISTDNPGTWKDIGLSDGQYADDGAVHIITNNSRVLERVFTGDVYPEWWGVIANDGLIDTTGLKAAVKYCVSNNKPLHLSGFYNVKGANSTLPGLVIPGRTANGSGIKINAEGSRSSGFIGSNCSIVVQYGTTASDVLNGVVSGFSIQADSTIDGIKIISNAPASGAFNLFEDLYFKNVKKAIDLVSSNVSNTTSSYTNTFKRIRIEKYWGKAISVIGVYNSFEDCFIVDPYGGDNPFSPSTAKGANSLALYVEGSNNSFKNMQFEDQFYIVGNNNIIEGASAIEFIKKGTPYSAIGASAFRISGYGNRIEGLSISGVPKSVINNLGSIAGIFNTIRSVTYSNLNDTRFDVLYPIMPDPGSSGTMDNIYLYDTSNHAVFYLNNPAFAANIADWSLRNVLGSDGLFSRDNHLTISEGDPNSLHTTGGTVYGNTTFNQILESPQLKATSLFYDESTHKIVNVAGTDYSDFITIPTQGKRSLANVQNVAGVSAQFSSSITSGSGNVTNMISGIARIDTSLEVHGIVYDYSSGHYMLNKASNGVLNTFSRDVSGSEAALNVNNVGTINANGNEVLFGGLASATGFSLKYGSTATGKILFNGIDLNNAGLTLQYKSLGTFYDGMVLDRFGRTAFASTVSASPGTQPNDLVTKSQLDSAGRNFTISNAVGTGDSLFYFPNDSTATAKRIELIGATKDVTATKITYTVNAPINGTVSFTGDGSTTSFTIPLSVAGLNANSKIFFDAKTPIGAAINWVEKSTESITIYYLTAPTSGLKTLNYILVL